VRELLEVLERDAASLGPPLARAAYAKGLAVTAPDGSTRPIPITLTPVLLEREEIRRRADSSARLASAALKMARFILGGPHSDVLALALSPLERRIAEKTFRAATRLATARVDYFLPGDASGPRALEINATIPAMQGYSDIAAQSWIEALAARDLLAPGFATVALSYIGSELTAAIYRRGTIGAAKDDLEATARVLSDRLRAACGGWAATSVNGAAVTQSSTAIPGIALYVGLLRRVLGERMRPPIDQLVDLWDHILGTAPSDVDEQGRIRLDRWELEPDVQAEMASRWAKATNDTIADLADLDWFRGSVRQLYGFSVPGVDYDRPTEPDLPWPSSRG